MLSLIYCSIESKKKYLTPYYTTDIILAVINKKDYEMERFKVGKIAKHADVNVETIRYYEKIKLMPKPQRIESRYRVYDEVDLKRLQFIKRSKELGFTLKEIKELLNMKIEFQHFPGCPNSPILLKRVKEVISDYCNIEFEEVIVDTNEKAEKLKFRGSPTLLINGVDYEDREEPISASLNCRVYQNGLPEAEEIRRKLLNYYFQF